VPEEVTDHGMLDIIVAEHLLAARLPGP